MECQQTDSEFAQLSTFSKWTPFFLVFVIYLTDNQLDFPISLCLTSCFIFHFYYLVYLMLRSFLKVETCVPIFTYFSTVTRYVTCSGPRLSNVPDGEQVVLTVVLFPSTSSHTTYTTWASPARLKTREMACVLPWVYTVVLNREVTCSCCSGVTSAEGWPLYRRGYLNKLRMQCIFVFLWVSHAIADREKVFVTWVSTVTPKGQKVLWCCRGISSVAALKVSMDCHILFELDSDTTGEVRHVLL